MNSMCKYSGGYHSYSISLIRLISMLLIVTCHIMQWLDWELAWWFNVGVQIFLCISGYLYGQSKKQDVVVFYKSRFIKILVPYFIVFFVAVGFEICFVRSELSVVNVIGGLFCKMTIPGGEHLWFIKYILLCYLITPLLTIYRDKYVHDGKSWWLFSIISVVVTSAFFGVHIQSFNPAWMTCYVIGFALGANKGYCSKGVLVSLFVVVTVICNGIQIYVDYIVRASFTGLLDTLYSYYQDYSHVLLGVSLFLIMIVVFDKIHFSDKFVQVLNISDKYSYAIYLVHQFFILGSFSLMALTPMVPVNIIIIIGCILVSTWVLKLVENSIVKWMEK